MFVNLNDLYKGFLWKSNKHSDIKKQNRKIESRQRNYEKRIFKNEVLSFICQEPFFEIILDLIGTPRQRGVKT